MPLALGSGGLDEVLGEVQKGDDVCAAGSEKGGVVALAAAEVETDQPRNGRKHREEHGRVDEVAIDVEAGLRQLGPCRGVRVPELRLSGGAATATSSHRSTRPMRR